MAKLSYEVVAATHDNTEGYNNTVLLQDLMALTAIISPIIICIGFFFTLKAKTAELEKSITELGKSFNNSMANAHEMLLLKIDAKLVIFNERMDILKLDTKENAEQIKEIYKEIKVIRNQKQDILNQLSRMGIDLYVLGDNDRRRRDEA